MTDDDVLRPTWTEGFLQFRPTECESYRGPATKAAKLQRVHVQLDWPWRRDWGNEQCSPPFNLEGS